MTRVEGNKRKGHNHDILVLIFLSLDTVIEVSSSCQVHHGLGYKRESISWGKKRDYSYLMVCLGNNTGWGSIFGHEGEVENIGG